MADRFEEIAASRLEGELRALAAGIEYPPTPPLAAAVHRRLAAAPVPARGLARRPPVRTKLPLGRLAASLIAAMLVLAVLGLAAFPQAREAVADRLGVRGIAVTQQPEPAPSAGPTAVSAPETPAASNLGLGRAVTLSEAQDAAAFPVMVPAAIAGVTAMQPDAVYLDEGVPGGMVSLVYRRPGGSPTDLLLLSEFRGDLQPGPVAGKGLPPGARIEAVTVAGSRGFWIEGEPHLFYFYRDPGGGSRQDQTRLAGNTLLWERDGLTLRLEGQFSKGTALEIAESIKAAG